MGRQGIHLAVLDPLGINTTQLIGLLSFAASTIACVIAARRLTGGSARIWWVLGVINALFFFEIYIGSRHRIHDYVNFRLVGEWEYGQRRGLHQAVLIGVSA